MIIGTAGHIDHGKTTLVRALTGVDTDRLREEKERGISIELGYAYVGTSGGETLGFIDVPGHERLVHTMVAGAGGIDFVLLVIAADDGVMPQTREHLAILELLGVREGAVALSKIDRVDEQRTLAAAAQITALLSPTAAARCADISAECHVGGGSGRGGAARSPDAHRRRSGRCVRRRVCSGLLWTAYSLSRVMGRWQRGLHWQAASRWAMRSR
jgi:selenocysteine-specific elongation factor